VPAHRPTSASRTRPRIVPLGARCRSSCSHGRIVRSPEAVTPDHVTKSPIRRVPRAQLDSVRSSLRTWWDRFAARASPDREVAGRGGSRRDTSDAEPRIGARAAAPSTRCSSLSLHDRDARLVHRCSRRAGSSTAIRGSDRSAESRHVVRAGHDVNDDEWPGVGRESHVRADRAARLEIEASASDSGRPHSRRAPQPSGHRSQGRVKRSQFCAGETSIGTGQPVPTPAGGDELEGSRCDSCHSNWHRVVDRQARTRCTRV